MKTAGILGGFGPESTAKFQLEIVDIFRARNINTRPPLLIWQTPILLKIEEDFIQKSKGASKFLPFLIQGAKKLEKAGADFLVIPCNSLHILIKELSSSIQLPIVSIVEETSIALSIINLTKVGLIGTKVFIDSNLIQKALFSNNIETILPSMENQELINESIGQILANKNLTQVKKTLLKITQEFFDLNAKDVLLVCTDLKPFCSNVKGVAFHDTLQILANATANKILDARCH